MLQSEQCYSLCTGRLVDVEELVMPAGGTHQAPKPMVPVNRPVGQNDVGMIAWVLTCRTPECPQGRKVRLLLHSIRAFRLHEW